MTEQDSTFNQPIAWRPTTEIIERAQLTKFIGQCGAKDFDDLYQKSIEDVEWFTGEVLKFLNVEFEPNYERLLDTSLGIEWSRWCVGGGLNITSHCLDRWQNEETRDQPAVIWEGEEGTTRQVTYAELLREVELCAAGLRSHGFKKNDAIGIHLPMMIETVVALMAIGRIGAIAVPVFSGYGASAIETRLNAVGAKALFTCGDFPRRGKKIAAFAVAYQAATNCPTVQKIFVVHRSPDERTAELTSELEQLKEINQRSVVTVDFSENAVSQIIGKSESSGYKFSISGWQSLLRAGSKTYGEKSSIEPTAAEDPLIILYTSGTTGQPKGIAHVHCGFPIKAAQDMAFGTDVGKGTRISWVTDIGWMMGPWLIYGALMLGATVVLYDGAPDYPKAERLWEFCASHKVEILGISPTLVRSLATHGDEPPQKHDLSSLRAFASTGEPWNPAPWWWLFEKVGDSKLPIINYSGGTEISGGILMGNPLLPIKPCSFPAACPGIAADILDESGESVADGRVGELAIKQPWIGMARGFWQEAERYIEAYWSRVPGVWVHGDWATRDPEGHWFILGRSDDTLKVAGKRVGPAEVESVLVNHPLVAEAAVIGVPDEQKGTAMIAFCILIVSADVLAAPTLEDQLKNLVADAMGKPLKPNRILFVAALPKTRNAKVMRRVIRAAYLGEDAGDLTALENPDAVREITRLVAASE